MILLVLNLFWGMNIYMYMYNISYTIIIYTNSMSLTFTSEFDSLNQPLKIVMICSGAAISHISGLVKVLGLRAL